MWAGTWVLLKSHIADRAKTISQHAAKSRRFHIVYGLFEIAIASMFALFMFDWFIPYFGFGFWFEILIAAGIVGIVAAAIIPARSGWRGVMHSAAAYGMAITLLATTALIALSPAVNAVAKLVAAAAITYMLVGWILLICYSKWSRRHMLLFQSVYFAAFHLTILAASYL